MNDLHLKSISDSDQLPPERIDRLIAAAEDDPYYFDTEEERNEFSENLRTT